MTDKRPDLARLSPEEKDALIRDLWRQVAAGQSEARLLKRRLGRPRPAPASRAARASCSRNCGRQRRARRVQPPSGIAVKLGRGLRLWRSPVVLGVVGIVLAAFAIDGGIGIYQARALQQQRQARLLLEHEALTSLYVELKRIVQEPDGKSYRMTLAMQNIDPGQPLYVMLNRGRRLRPVGHELAAGALKPRRRHELGRRQAGRRLFL